MKATMALLIASGLAAALAGCQATPSRTARAQCGGIYINVWPAVCDGVTNAVTPVAFEVNTAYVSNETGGSETVAPSMPMDIKPEAAVGLGGSSAGTGAAAPQSGLVGGAAAKLTPE